jgi:hypothetical protein
VIGRAVVHNLGNSRLVGIAYHPMNAGHTSDLFRSALRVASGYQNSRRGIFAIHPAHGLAYILVGGGGNSASVQDNELRVGNRAYLR